MRLPPILLTGCGKMGSAMLAGWVEQGATEIVAVEPNVNAGHIGAQFVHDAAAIPVGFAPGIVVLAIKPQEAAAALPAYARFAAAGVPFLSIMAGRSSAAIRTALGGEAAVVRAMPNTPAAIRRGFSVAFADPDVTAAHRALADTLLGAIGEVAWVEDEALLDPVTAVSGGGPAYVFLLAEVMTAAAIAEGIPAELAARMARATVAGSGALLGASVEDAAALRRAVTSPHGTTERALAVLMADAAWPALMRAAVAAATARSRELAG